MKPAKFVVFCFLAVGTLAAQDVMAQFGSGPPEGGMPGGGIRGQRMQRGEPPRTQRPATEEDMENMIDYRLSLLQEDLKLSADQEGVWRSYSDKVHFLLSDITRERRRLQSGMSMNALQQVDHAVDVARNRLTAWEDVAVAAKTLYQQLTPPQRAMVDARFSSIFTPITDGGAVNPYERAGVQRITP
ncbi:MAG TPA: Spy/CpxP family protein refolding chaperone [Burkholderiales bacterium]|nr:Spy/CpxP family protein refolding chaperone [Burkholderiales bacterium]